MGMFDNVDFDMPCPLCGTMLEDWQSKDDDCALRTISINKVNRFYECCKKCGLWIEFEAKKVDGTLVFIPTFEIMEHRKEKIRSYIIQESI